MRFLADEGVDGFIVDAVRHDGHDVRWMAEDVDGTKDSIVLEAAVLDARILITEDKDFGELFIASDCITAVSCSFASMVSPTWRRPESSPVRSGSTRPIFPAPSL